MKKCLGMPFVKACVMAALLCAVSSSHASASLPESKRPGAEVPVLQCKAGTELHYAYSAVFVSQAEVETDEGVGGDAASLMAEATVSMTAMRSHDGICTRTVRLSDVHVYEIVGGEIVQETGRTVDLDQDIYNSFYFDQDDSGQVLEVMLQADESSEVVSFKRGVVQSMNFTLRSEGRYRAIETDQSGTYVATYAAQMSSERINMTRTRSHENYVVNGLGAQGAVPFATSQTAAFEFDMLGGCLRQINIDETVIVDQPEVSDLPISDHFRHETLTVRAAIDVVLIASSFNPGSGMALKRNMDEGDLVRIPTGTPIDSNPEVGEHSVIIADLVAPLEQHPDDRPSVIALARAVRTDATGVDQLDRHLHSTIRDARVRRAVASVLIAEGSDRAQEVLRMHFLSNVQDVKNVEYAVGMSTLLETPSPSFVAAIEALASNPTSDHWVTATLALGAFAHALRGEAPERAKMLVETLEAHLDRAGGHPDAQLYLRALGNAGAERSLPLIVPYLRSADEGDRLAAIVAMRKVESSDVEELLVGHYAGETSATAKKTLVRVIEQRALAETSPASIQAKSVLVDFSWSETYGGNIASATASVAALVEDEPYLVDISTAASAQVFGNSFTLIDVQLLTEEVSPQARRFRFFVTLANNEIANIDETAVCDIAATNTIWQESISLFQFETPPIGLGPLSIRVATEGALAFSVNFLRAGEWCSGSSDLTMALTPGVALYVDGYGTLSLLVIRGGIGIAGNVIDIEFPISADAAMVMQDAREVCFNANARLQAIDMELYAWGQYWLPFRWRPNPRPRWTLWDFQVADLNWNLHSVCDNNPELQCLQDVLWWDGSIIDAWYDGANCWVSNAPQGSDPFIANNSYYIAYESDCPDESPWDGVACREAMSWTRPAIDVDIFPQGDKVRLTISNSDEIFGTPFCPMGWTQVLFNPLGSRTCERTPPPGFSPSDYFVVLQGTSLFTVYLEGGASCVDGSLNTIGCRLGVAPLGTSAFLLSGNTFYYAEP